MGQHYNNEQDNKEIHNTHTGCDNCPIAEHYRSLFEESLQKVHKMQEINRKLLSEMEKLDSFL